MTSAAPGSTTSAPEILNVSAFGIWLLVDQREYFLPFDQFPWFRQATIGQIMKLERPHPDHLYWPELDVDLSIESLEAPERFPLIAR